MVSDYERLFPSDDSNIADGFWLYFRRLTRLSGELTEWNFRLIIVKKHFEKASPPPSIEEINPGAQFVNPLLPSVNPINFPAFY